MLYGSGDGNHVGSLSRLSLINGDKQPSMALLKRIQPSGNGTSQRFGHTLRG
jgi:hypothetical protein